MSLLRVGLVGLWFERGNAYLTAGLREMLLPAMEPFVYARTGYIVGAKGREKHMEVGGRWQVPNVTRLPDYGIDPAHCASWIRDNNLCAVIWNEEYNHALVRRVRTLLSDYKSPAGIECQQVAYLDWVGQDPWVAELPGTYHHLICATSRTQRMMGEKGVKSHKFQWSVDLDLFKPKEEEPTHLFFHNAGWAGTNFRKGSIAVLNAWQLAFKKSYKVLPNHISPSLLIHTQKPLKEWPSGCQTAIQKDPRIQVIEGTITAPGLYHRGWVYVGPSLLEGLGLTFPEALASGLPLITTDAPPMNEHGDDILCTKVSVKSTKMRGDGCAFPENYVDIQELAEVMDGWARRDKQTLLKLRREARACAERLYSREKNAPDFQNLIRGFLYA